MKTRIFLLVIISMLLNVAYGQQSKWIIGGGQMDTSGNYYSLGTNRLKFYELDFNVSPIQVNSRNLGNSLNNIVSVGTADPLVTAYSSLNGQTKDLKFYVFAAAKSPQISNPINAPSDTFYIASFDSQTQADEVVTQFPTKRFGSSVVDIEMTKLPCHNKEEDYYLILYKTVAATLLADEINYVIYNHSNRALLQQPTALDQNLLSGEGMAISQTAPGTNSKYFFYTNLDTTGNTVVLKLMAATITKTGINTPFVIDTVQLNPNAYPGINVCGIEIAPDNQHLALTIYAGSLKNVVPSTIIYDFNISNCSVTNRRQLFSSATITNTTFSPNGQLIYSYSNSLNSLFYYSLPISSSITSDITSASSISFSGIIKPGGLHMQAAIDGNMYFNPGHGTKTLIKIQSPNSNPTFTTLGNYFFGATNWAGNDLPEQIDGQDYTVDTCAFADGIMQIKSPCAEIQSMNFIGRNSLENNLKCSTSPTSFYGKIKVLNAAGTTIFDGELEHFDSQNLTPGLFYFQINAINNCPISGRICIPF